MKGGGGGVVVDDKMCLLCMRGCEIEIEGVFVRYEIGHVIESVNRA